MIIYVCRHQAVKACEDNPRTLRLQSDQLGLKMGGEVEGKTGLGKLPRQENTLPTRKRLVTEKSSSKFPVRSYRWQEAVADKTDRGTQTTKYRFKCGETEAGITTSLKKLLLSHRLVTAQKRLPRNGESFLFLLGIFDYKFAVI